MTAISIHAVLDGVVHPLDTRERMFAWFGRPATPAEYFVSYRGSVYEFDGLPYRKPVSPSDLVAKALDRIPGKAPRHSILDWSLYDDFTRGQCGWLALALAERVGGRPMICGLLPGSYHDIGEPVETDTEWYMLDAGHMDCFMHAGVLVGEHVHCAMGRQEPGMWAWRISRSEEMAMCGLVSAETMRDGLDALPIAVVDTIPDVVELLMQLIGDEDEPEHPSPCPSTPSTEINRDVRDMVKGWMTQQRLGDDEDHLAEIEI